MKQYSAIVFCVLMAISGQTFGAPLDGANNGDCPGGLENGAQLERGRFFYECSDGNIVPKGCVSDDLKHLQIGATFDRKRHRLQCALSSDGLLSFEPVACLQNGAEHKINEEWEEGSNYYNCKKFDDGDVRSVNVGCIDQGRRVPLNTKVTKEDFVYVCNETVNNGARLMQTACTKDGREIDVGETFESGNVWYSCTRTGREKVSAKATGCVNNGKRLNDGDRYFENDVVYECIINNGKNEVRAIGCAQRDDRGEVVERKLGCTWVEGPEPFQYEWLCQRDDSGNSAKKVQVRCNYNVGGGLYQIAPGCYRIVDKNAVGCLKEGAGLKVQSFQGVNAEQSASSAGLRSC